MAKNGSQSSFLKTAIISSIVAALFLFIANSAVWVNRYIFNSDNFSRVAVESITSESSRQAIAQRVTDEALSDRPVIKNIVNDTSVNLISGVLGTDQVRQGTEVVVKKLHVAVTSDNKDSISIDLSGVKSFLDQVVGVVSNYRDVKVDPNKIPSQIELINKENIPDFYRLGVFFLWLGPLALLGALALLAYPYFRQKIMYKSIMLIQGSAILLVGLLSLLIGPLFEPPLMSNIPNPNGRIVASNLYNAFIDTFNTQTMILIVVGALVIVVSSVLLILPKIRPKKN